MRVSNSDLVEKPFRPSSVSYGFKNHSLAIFANGHFSLRKLKFCWQSNDLTFTCLYYLRYGHGRLRLNGSKLQLGQWIISHTYCRFPDGEQ